MQLNVGENYKLHNPHSYLVSNLMAIGQLINATFGGDCDSLWGGRRRFGYILNWLIALDQLGNTLTGGHPHETISSRLGRRKARKALTWRQPLSKLIDNMLEIIDDNHSKDAIGT